MTDYSSARDTINALAEQLRHAHKRYVGAQFRLAFWREGGEAKFLTGHVVFQPTHVPSRPAADYGTLLMVEYWCREQDAALSLLSKLLSGEAEIEAHQIKATFHRSHAYRATHPVPTGGWSGLQVSSSRDRGADYREINVGQQPVLALGMRPYLSPGNAVHQWLFDISSDTWSGQTVPYQDQVVTFLPDTRARIVYAQWTPGKLALEVDINVPNEDVEIQVVHSDSQQPYQLLPPPSGRFEIDVPDDARQLYIHIVHRCGDCVATVWLRSLYEGFGEAYTEIRSTERCVIDLGRGESETVEFKPFLSPNHEKETEFVESVIAFGNTAGGRIYIGVLDRNGTTQGRPALHKAFRKSRQPIREQADRLRWLITNKVRPIPKFKVEDVVAFGEPVVVAAIERGLGTTYSTHDNRIFIRKGATNKLATVEELKELFGAGGVFGQASPFR